jgi:hypothetical protein
MTYNFPIQLVNGPDELNNERMLLWPYCVSNCATNIRRSVETGTIKGRNARDDVHLSAARFAQTRWIFTN